MHPPAAAMFAGLGCTRVRLCSLRRPGRVSVREHARCVHRGSAEGRALHSRDMCAGGGPQGPSRGAQRVCARPSPFVLPGAREEAGSASVAPLSPSERNFRRKKGLSFPRPDGRVVPDHGSLLARPPVPARTNLGPPCRMCRPSSAQMLSALSSPVL
ncbi:hypothetical protein OBBRIDRAFT_793551 [Obba rivulosa]|uniref:Uncharacterized protein n=1 Tax=Obba rivulosa TaxID=1052685 RepID=A0A8E2AXU3_9APHY|nr:hypothetical protein OBBRIDRAFT_793551 [Obba rivulosa]